MINRNVYKIIAVFGVFTIISLIAVMNIQPANAESLPKYSCDDPQGVGTRCCAKVKSTSVCSAYCEILSGTCKWSASETSKCTAEVISECTMAMSQDEKPLSFLN